MSEHNFNGKIKIFIFRFNKFLFYTNYKFFLNLIKINIYIYYSNLFIDA